MGLDRAYSDYELERTKGSIVISRYTDRRENGDN
jgi:hypothetical protein